MRIAMLLLALSGLFAACEGTLPFSTVTDDTPPVVLAVNPADGAVGVPRNVRYEVRFDDRLDPAGIDPAGIRIERAADGLALAVSNVRLALGFTNRVLHFESARLADGTNYRVRIAAGAVRNASGLALAAERVAVFTAGAGLADYTPVFTVVSPTNGQFSRSRVTFVGASANLTGLQYRFNGTGVWVNDGVSFDGGGWAINNLDTTRFADGTNTLELQAFAVSGAASSNVRFVVDNTAPVLSITSPGGVVTRTNATTGTAVDSYGVKRVQFRTNGGPWVDATGTTAWQYAVNTWEHPDDAALTNDIRVEDLAGNATTNRLVTTVSNWAKTQLVAAAQSYGNGFASTYDDGVRLVYYGVSEKIVSDDGYTVSTFGSPNWMRYARHGGTNHVVYTLYDSRLGYSKSTGASYTATYENSTMNNGSAGGCGMAIDSSGGIFVAYSEGISSGAAVCRYLPPGSSTWVTNLLDATAGPKNGFSATVDASGTFYVTYYTYLTGDVWKYGYSSVTWSGGVLTVGAFNTLSVTGWFSYPDGCPNLSASAWFANRLGFLITDPYAPGSLGLYLTIIDGGNRSTKTLVSGAPNGTLGRSSLAGDATGQAYVAYRLGTAIYVARGRYGTDPVIRKVASARDTATSLGADVHYVSGDGSLVVVFMKPDKSIWSYRTTGF